MYTISCIILQMVIGTYSVQGIIVEDANIKDPVPSFMHLNINYDCLNVLAHGKKCNIS